MALADAVAALPGGGEFAALWTQVNGDPGAISDLAGTLQAAASKAEDSARTISKTAGEVGDAWHGSAAHAFAGYMHRFGAAASSVHAGDGQGGHDDRASRAARVEREAPAQLDRQPDPRPRPAARRR